MKMLQISRYQTIYCQVRGRKIEKEMTMVDYKKYENDEDFMAILDYLRCYSLANEWEVSETLDIDLEIVNKNYKLAQGVVAEEIANGECTHYDSDVALGFMDYIAYNS